ncbi:aminodeoxychorismate synthase [Plasmopara halstedii]|uniref:aminodeoxychorismate synthase n=1 Tax=Plasmopara halstedii TaxID=4781 RepID=A0A0P1AGI4_PLAHL|nr:aminodeoxychorismate synthase [Plasmopara halstedii]CEG39788.1 aminodeoxychorismate synthase [Plasmopara halstedii]|eukprot:XP_024576157.1 aminodeoxychorismate synthase [Plasmopara halstedii]
MVASMDDVPASVSIEKAFIKKKPRRVASLLIDNYDSYTYNIMQMLTQVNGSPNSVTVIKNDDFGGHFVAAWDSFVEETTKIAARDGVEIELNVILSPGPGHPAEKKDFGMCADAIRYATVPILGVCLGHQGLAHVYGGQVIKARDVMHGRISRVVIEECNAFFAYIPNEFQVVRYHSLVIQPDNIPKELKVIARTTNGDIMAVQHRDKIQYGVQFHPEAVCSEYGYQLLQNFRDVTLAQCASMCLLHHRIYPDQKDHIYNCLTTTTAPKYRVLVQRASTELASLEFAEFVFRDMFGDSKRSFWLDSSNYDTVAGTEAATQSRFSMMGDNSGPMSYCVEYDVSKVELRVLRRRADVEDEEVTVCRNQDILTHVREVMQAHQSHQVLLEGSEVAPTALPFAFRGGFVGYFGYEVLDSEQKGSKLKNDEVQVQRECTPDASFLFTDRTLVFDHRDGVVYSLSISACTVESESDCRQWHSSMMNQLKQMCVAYRLKVKAPPACMNVASQTDEVIFRPSRSRAQYVADIEEIQRLIREGETYEVCLTNHLRAEYALRDALAFYCMLRRRNPAPFAGFYLSDPKKRFQTSDSLDQARTANDTYALCCSSPERFLQVQSNGWMESKPIKGTRRRGCNPNEDAVTIEELANCEKDRAENMMIADLVRNDFGAIARVGSVHVPRLMSIETYATVHQLVTTVRAQRRQNTDVVDVLRATFPGGSMTGAPKKRTMQIIRHLERGPRGIYSGALGFLSIDGSCDLNIIIRTAIVTPNSVTLGAGGAIVALSDPNDEYEEMLLKAQALVSTIGEYAMANRHDTGARVVVD